MNLFGLTSIWENFLKDFIDEGFTISSFFNEYQRIVNECTKLLSPYNQEEISKKCQYVLNNSDIDNKLEIKGFSELDDGEYIYIDIHSDFDYVLKYIGVFNPSYNDTYDIINNITNYKIFRNLKVIRLNIYDRCLSQNIRKQLFNISTNILLEKIYQNEDPKLKEITKHYQCVYKTLGDCYVYKVDNGEFPNYTETEFEYDGIKYHIEKLICKTVYVLGNYYKVELITDNNNIKHALIYLNNQKIPVSQYPFLIKLALGEELNDKDLTVGYEDEIFFHFDKSEII